MKAINLEAGDKLINQGVNISIDFTSEKKPWCGLRVDWGNGKSQPVRVGHDGDEGAPTSPIKLSNTYNTPGKYNIIVKGELLVRGLTGTALPCEVKTSAAEVVVIDPVADSQFIQKAWSSYFASLESRPLQLQCVKIGIPILGVKNESIVAGDKLTSIETPVAKTLIERCLAFQQAKKPEINVSCKIASGNNYFDTNCDGYYAEKQADGALKSITIEDAITLQVQGKSWVVGLQETESGKAARLAAEIAMKEKEKQRALEAERQKAAELKAKKDAQEALLLRWKDTGFAVSPLPPCPLNGKFHNCFGSGKDSNGNEYIGEMKNNSLVGLGIVIYNNGDRYVGEYDGGRNGEGISYYLIEDEKKAVMFVGQYKNNLINGSGIHFDRSGNVIESGIYQSNLIEYRYIDPATFTRIPAGKIPVISADARLKIERKQAEIVKERTEKLRIAALEKQMAAEKSEKDRLAALEKLKVKGVGLGLSQAPCKPTEENYVDILQKPVRIQLECSIGSDRDTTDVIFSIDGKRVVRVTRTQYLLPSDAEPKEVINAAIKFYGQPKDSSEDNWLATYGDAFTVSRNGQAASTKMNDTGFGLLIRGSLCGDGNYGTEKCGNKGTKVIKYDLIDVEAYKRQMEDGKEKLSSKNKAKLNNQQF